MTNEQSNRIQSIREKTQNQRLELPRGEKSEIKFAPSQQDFLKLCEKLEDRDVELAVRLAARAALRPQEIRNLQEEDVTITQQTIEIQVEAGDRKRHRTAPVNKYERLEELLSENSNESEKLISSETDAAKEIRKTRKEFELPETVQLHLQGLRYTAIINFFRQDYSLHQVLDILGRTSSGKLRHLQKEVNEEIQDELIEASEESGGASDE